METCPASMLQTERCDARSRGSWRRPSPSLFDVSPAVSSSDPDNQWCTTTRTTTRPITRHRQQPVTPSARRRAWVVHPPVAVCRVRLLSQSDNPYMSRTPGQADTNRQLLVCQARSSPWEDTKGYVRARQRTISGPSRPQPSYDRRRAGSIWSIFGAMPFHRVPVSSRRPHLFRIAETGTPGRARQP